MENKWLSYWKKSLSDSLNADIDLDKLKHFEIENFKIESSFLADFEKVNELIDFEESRMNTKRGITDRRSENWVPVENIKVLIAPLKVVPIPENQSHFKDKKIKY